MATRAKWRGGRLTFWNNALVEENVESVTSAQDIKSYGLTVIGTTANATYTLDPPHTGVVKDILVGTSNKSSFVATIRGSSVANQVTFASPSSDSQNAVVLTPGSTYPAGVTLRAISTSQWAITGVVNAGTTLMSGNTVTLSTVCT